MVFSSSRKQCVFANHQLSDTLPACCFWSPACKVASILETYFFFLWMISKTLSYILAYCYLLTVQNVSPVWGIVFWCNKTRIILTCGVITGIFSLMKLSVLLSDSSSLPVHSSLIRTYFKHTKQWQVSRVTRKDLGVFMSGDLSWKVHLRAHIIQRL